MVDFLIGADPEFFLIDKETGKHVSAYGMIEGTKEKPFKVDRGAVQVDGMALEFNIDPASTMEEFDLNITTVLRQLREMIDDRYEFSFVPVAEFGKEYIDAQPKKAKELGCDPDYNAYTGDANPAPNGNLGIRTASGHIHIGWTKDMNPDDPGHFEACRMLTKQLDFSLMLASLCWEWDEVRASMYGQPGAFRPKSYGVEYRVLSNRWVNHPTLRKIVFRNTKYMAEILMRGSRYYEAGLRNGESQQDVIHRKLSALKKGHLGTAMNAVPLYAIYDDNSKEHSLAEFVVNKERGAYYKWGENAHLFEEKKGVILPKKEEPLVASSNYPWKKSAKIADVIPQPAARPAGRRLPEPIDWGFDFNNDPV